MREAKLEAMGLPLKEERRPRHDKPQMATDELVGGAAHGWVWMLTVGLGHGAVQETDATIMRELSSGVDTGSLKEG